MATYKVWLTVKDRYGSIKKLDGGNINIDLDTVDEDEVKAFDEHFATDTELVEATETSPETIRYAGFEIEASTKE